MKPPRFRPSLREVKLANNKADAFYAALAGKEPMAQNVIAPKRERTPQRNPSDSGGVDIDGVHYKQRLAAIKTGAPTESEVLSAIRDSLKRHPRVTLYRNNRGQVILPSGGRLTYGVGPNGAADLLGWREVRITADMVGEKIAQFTALEVKRPGAKPDPEQRAFLDAVYAAGGCSGWADTVEAALAVVERKP